MIEVEVEPCPFDEVMPGERKEPVKLVRFALLFVLYDTNSPLQAMLSLFYAKVKIKGEWVYKGAKNTWFKKNLPLLEVYKLITGKTFKAETDTLRSITDEKEAKKFKATHFNYGCFSGTFFKREDDNLIDHSGLICIDLDHLDEELERVRAIVNSDPKTLMSFCSPSGNGLKVIYKINPDMHSQRKYYLFLSSYLTELCSLPKQKIDKSCTDVSRACFLPYDPDAYLNVNLL